MAGILVFLRNLIFILLFSGLFCSAISEENILATIALKENHSLKRQLEYIEVTVQFSSENNSESLPNFIVQNELDNKIIPCQIIQHTNYKSQNIEQVHLIFPVSMEANQTLVYKLKYDKTKHRVESDLSYSGKGFDITIDNTYYQADLTKSNQSDAKSHESGQLRELLIKRGFDVLLFRSENRMHWAPNFKNQRVEYYKTIAGWERPENYQLMSGPYLIRTTRNDKAPQHEEILLSANYSFYAGLPYFRFYSSMVIEQDVILSLLRNDEMTMDSLFTHIAYQKKSGEIIDLSFAERHEVLDLEPISNEAPWLCFYNAEKGYAFGSIRIKYDITTNKGLPSPTYLPHTKISDGAEGGKYWNRRLIHDQPVLVNAGSRYIEENAYIIFKISKDDKFSEIKKWSAVIQHPVEVTIKFNN